MEGFINFEYMHKDEVVARVSFNQKKKIGKVTMLSSNIWDRPVGMDTPTWEDLRSFFADRVFEEARPERRRFLKQLHVDFYEPYRIALETHGILWDDFYWVRFEGEHLTYEDVKLRD